MRWFRRSKEEKEETKSLQEETPTDLISEPPFEESKKKFPENEEQVDESSKEDLQITTIAEEQKNDLDIQNQIKTQTEHLKTLSKKLEDVKSEYDKAVSILMELKRELIHKKTEINLLSSQYQGLSKKIEVAKKELDTINIKFSEKRKELDELEKSDVVITKLKKEIGQYKNEHENIKGKTLETQSMFDQINIKKENARTELETTYNQLRKAREELEKIYNDKKAIAEEIKKSKEKAIKEKFNESDLKEMASKQVIEAASAVVAQMKSKLNIAQKEIEALSKLIERERKEHRETKEKLEKLMQEKGKNLKEK